MRRRLLDFLACPACGGGLNLAVARAAGDVIEAGTLACLACGAAYPVRNGIPRMLPKSLARTEAETASAFGWEWRHFTALSPAAHREQFADWVAPLGPADFAGRVVLDAGCGMGRLTGVAVEWGAAEVIGLDISEAVDAARAHLGDHPRVHLVQGDILAPPFRRGPGGGGFDLAYSVGVLHHLPDPACGFQTLVEVLAPGGCIAAWVYGREGNGWIVRWVTPIRLAVFSRLPRRLLYVIAWALALGLYPLACLLATGGAGTTGPPAGRYLGWLRRYGIRYCQHVIFDQLVAPVAHYLAHAEFAAWFRAAGLANVVITSRYGTGWRGTGVRRTAEEGSLRPGGDPREICLPVRTAG